MSAYVCLCASGHALLRGNAGEGGGQQSRVNDNCLKTLQLNLLGERDFGHKY